jgi:hypothetical protein
MLDKKLQVKAGQSVAIIGSTSSLELEAPKKDPDQADIWIIFVISHADLESRIAGAQEAARRGVTVWAAYPKGKQLNTDLNRDIIREFAAKYSLDTVRMIAVDEIWSALRLKLI